MEKQRTVYKSPKEVQEELHAIALGYDTIDATIVRKTQLEWLRDHPDATPHELRVFTLQAIQNETILIGDKRGY